jgi:DNA-binding beta-propeller fold protein YncE
MGSRRWWLQDVLWLAMGFVLSGCIDRDTTRPDDKAPPSLQVLSPVDTTYDEDGDRLVDLRLTWHDADGAVDLGAVRVRSLGGLNGPATDTTNLLSAWRLGQFDGTGLTLHETVTNLLHGGPNAIEISVADTAGNMRVDTVRFTLPYGAFVKTIVTGLGPSATAAADGVTICPDDGRLYMTAGRNIVVVDPDSVRLIAVVPDPYAGDILSQPLCVPGDPVLYVTQFVERFHRPTLTWLPEVTGSFGSIGIVQSRADPNIIYVGETNSGTIGIIDRAQASRVGRLLPFSQPEQEFVLDLAVLDGDAKLYATRYQDGGILVVDPRRDSVLHHIAVGGLAGIGSTDAIVLSRDGRRLYASVVDGVPRGVVEIDTQADSVIRTLGLFDYLCIDLALSPSERRMFVTTQDNGSPSKNILVDMVNWQVLQTFPRPRTPAFTRFDLDVTFHPSGKFIFVTHNLDLDVYLNRE